MRNSPWRCAVCGFYGCPLFQSKPFDRVSTDATIYNDETIPVYSADQMHAYAAKAVAEALQSNEKENTENPGIDLQLTEKKR